MIDCLKVSTIIDKETTIFHEYLQSTDDNKNSAMNLGTMIKNDTIRYYLMKCTTGTKLKAVKIGLHRCASDFYHWKPTVCQNTRQIICFFVL